MVSTVLPSYHLHLLTTCSTRTLATGSDNLHPALHLKHVCDNALRAIAMIMTLAANIGFCPAVFATIILVLLPKKRMETHWALHKCAAGLLPIDSQSGYVELQALLVRADCARLPTRDVEVPHGRGIRHFGGFLRRLGAH